MNTRADVLKMFRQIHLYLGVFTAPAILFFAFTGVLQTFSLHDPSTDGSYKPATWIVTLAQIHKKQTTQLPLPKSKPAASSPSVLRSLQKKAGTPDEADDRPAHNPWPLKIFFLMVGIALFLSTLTGLYMSYQRKRSRVLLVMLFLAGIVLPIVLTFA